MDRYMVELMNRLNEIPNTKFYINNYVIYIHRFVNGSWGKWQPWHLSTEAWAKFNEYQKDSSKAVADLTGPAPMLRICAEVYLKVAG